MLPNPSLLYCPHNNLKPCQKQSAVLPRNNPAPSCHNTPKLLQNCHAMLLLNQSKPVLSQSYICTKLAYKSCTSKAMKIAYPSSSNFIYSPPPKPQQESSINKLFQNKQKGAFGQEKKEREERTRILKP